MIKSLQEIGYYFGAAGVASIVAWLIVAVLAIIFILFLRRSTLIWTAMALAIAAYVLAIVNSIEVSQIKGDNSQEISTERTNSEQHHSDSRVNDDSPSNGDDRPATAMALDSGESSESKYAYRQQGKVERTDGMQVEDKDSIDVGIVDEGDGDAYRTMNLKELAKANRLDNLNLMIVKLTFGGVLLLVVVDYFRRFNSTFDSYFPLPLGCGLLDLLFPKTYSVYDENTQRDWRTFLERTVRKGETFVVFRDQDPWSSRTLDRLPKWLLFRSRLEKVVVDASSGKFDSELVYESAWYGRYCFVVVGADCDSVTPIIALKEFLELRHATRAKAPQTVTIVWNRTEDIPRDTLESLIPLSHETNFKLIVTREDVPSSPIKQLFDEAHAELPRHETTPV